MLAGERSDFSLKRSSSYTKEIACSRVSGISRFCSLSVFPTQRVMKNGGIGERDTNRRSWFFERLRSLNFGAAKDISSAPRRNILKTRRSSSRYSARNDAISGCIVTILWKVYGNVWKRVKLCENMWNKI